MKTNSELILNGVAIGVGISASVMFFLMGNPAAGIGFGLMSVAFFTNIVD